jgi:mRNA interferase RelE/StbE
MAPAGEKYALRVPDSIAAVLRKLHPTVKSHIRSGLKTILENPNVGKALRDELRGLRSFRVKRYRIVYRIEAEKRHIEIIAVGPRRIIYEETFRLLSREKNK